MSTAGRWDRSVVALLVTVFCSSAASMAGVTALGKQIYDITGREIDLGLLGLAEFAPGLLLVLVTGAVADRYDRRRVVFVAAVGEAVVTLGLAAYAGSAPTAAAPIFLLVIALGIARAFVAPASRALPADIVPADQLSWLVPRFSATWQAALIFGPVLGGTLYAVDPTLPFLAMTALLLVAGVSVLFVQVTPIASVPVPVAVAVAPELDAALEAGVDPAMGHGEAAPRTHSSLHEAFEGLRFIRSHPVLLGAIALDLFAVLFGGAVALLPAIAEDRLGVGAVGLGWLRAAGGIGAGLVTLVLARRPLAHRVGRTLLTVVAVFGLGTIALGVTRSYVVAFVAMAVLSGADAVSVFIRATLVPLVTPAEKRGRVLAVENVFIGASNELGAFESGVAGQVLGPGSAIVLGGAATLVVAAAWWVLFPALRDVDEFPSS